MTMTSPTTSKIDSLAGHPEEAAAMVEQIKKKARVRKLRMARSLAARMRVAPDGSRVFLRFSRAQCLEHQTLLVSFTALSVTGLFQMYSQLFLVGLIIEVFGGIETMRTIHHLAAVVLILQSLYHIGRILETWFVKRERGGMWPYFRDFRDMFQMVAFNLSLAQERPAFDRFSIEEKLEYWALLWGTPLMIITGLIMWFPIVVTSVLPGEVIPISHALHGWEAILAILAILTWHMYHSVIKERNRSIFTGIMTETEMQHAHPLEYRRILAAHEYLQKVIAARAAKEDHNMTDDTRIFLKETGHEVV